MFVAPSVEERAAWRARIAEGREAHASIASSAAASLLTEVDVWRGGGTGSTAAPGAWLRIAAWNLERGRDAAAAGALLASVDADVVLLSEVDRGMARTGNVDVFSSLAGPSGAGASVGAFGVEFVELSSGDADERAALPDDAVDELGLHGNAVLSRIGLDDPCVLRLDEGGDWFTESRGQPRVGGRCAIAGRAGPLVVVSVHLESGSTADERATQLARLLAMVDDRFGASSPAVVGGDLNTFGAPIATLLDRASARSMRAAEPTRFSWPVPHEPLFDDVAARHGYGWVDANVAGPTTFHGPGGLPDHVPLHLDWLLVRGAEARRPTIVTGGGLSDHELVAVSVRVPVGGSAGRST